MRDSSQKTLEDVHESVEIKGGKFKRILSFFGPAYLISVGYMDPGNWATDIAGGSQFGYTLLWVLLMSNLMALLLQSLCARLGIVRRKDLAQCNRETYPKGINLVLYILAEIAIAACDLAEILGMAIGLNLLFGIDLFYGVLISFLDTFLLLYLQKLGMRKMELFIVGLISLIGMCFLTEMFLVKPDFTEVAKGFIPSIPNTAALYISIGIIGATVMPHNLYLHSALVQTRKIKRDSFSIKKALKYNFWDSAIALNLAFLVNATILILAAAVFHKNGMHDVAELNDAYRLLGQTLGTDLAPKLFAVALILAGQSSTVTGTLAGQIVMEGYLHLRINPVLRRILTRLLAVVPAMVVILVFGEDKVGSLLIFSQVILSMQLAFAVIPLIHFVSDKEKMGKFAINIWMKIAAWTIAIVISALNAQLVYQEFSDWLSENNSFWNYILVYGFEAFLVVLLIITFIIPILNVRKKTKSKSIHSPLLNFNLDNSENKSFKKIAVTLDFSTSDEKALSSIPKFANNETEIVLIHIVESAATKYTGEKTEDEETHSDYLQLERYARILQEKYPNVAIELGYNNRVKSIVEICKKHNAELLIVASHGHKGLKDFIFGGTINQLRHQAEIPLYIAR